MIGKIRLKELLHIRLNIANGQVDRIYGIN